jgi:hypothetical protein
VKSNSSNIEFANASCRSTGRLLTAAYGIGAELVNVVGRRRCDSCTRGSLYPTKANDTVPGVRVLLPLQALLILLQASRLGNTARLNTVETALHLCEMILHLRYGADVGGSGGIQRAPGRGLRCCRPPDAGSRYAV